MNEEWMNMRGIEISDKINSQNESTLDTDIVELTGYQDYLFRIHSPVINHYINKFSHHISPVFGNNNNQ
ncbi:hypothetical protein [Metabacillus malikii]|uniref:Uncharacterized protein n=1 Tax=Metabacillus malikii TaxID=1504265 RepID=A0ABT9ZMJ6_9BACI|nr:hypothetical protein [Metabacillus malikii]MDQ0233515.1 hypothetical protein [Metabacillus malikii]